MNDTKASGMLDQAKGKLKEAFGDATGNEKLANEGVADQVKGNVKESWGNVKDTASHLGDSAKAESHEHAATTDAEVHASNESFRDKVTAGAEHMKDSIKRGLDHLERKS